MTAPATLLELADRPYLVWSNEHRAWWGPGRCGYYTLIDSAGRYSREEAIAIASSARGGWSKGKNPPEIAMPEADAVEQATWPHRVEAWANRDAALAPPAPQIGQDGDEG